MTDLAKGTANPGIDLNRGVVHRETSGVEVYMYKDDPGVYLNAFGLPISEDLAKRAGFDIERFRRGHAFKDHMAKAEEQWKAQKGVADEAAHETVIERAGWKVNHISLGRHHIYDPDGNRITTTMVTREEALDLLDALVPPEPKKEAAPLPVLEPSVPKAERRTKSAKVPIAKRKSTT